MIRVTNIFYNIMNIIVAAINYYYLLARKNMCNNAQCEPYNVDIKRCVYGTHENTWISNTEKESSTERKKHADELERSLSNHLSRKRQHIFKKHVPFQIAWYPNNCNSAKILKPHWYNPASHDDGITHPAFPRRRHYGLKLSWAQRNRLQLRSSSGYN